MPISNITNTGSTFTFTINSPICIVNAIRRIIISDIPTFVFETTPEEKNNMVIDINTCRLNNEIMKQRFSCIPIHITENGMANNGNDSAEDINRCITKLTGIELFKNRK